MHKLMARTGIFILCVLSFPSFLMAAGLDSVKIYFLKGNYHRVISEAEAQLGYFNIQGADDLNYLLGLSYMKAGNLGKAEECLRRVANNPISRNRERALFSLADVDLLEGRLRKSEYAYKKLLEDYPGTSLKASVLFRLSRLANKGLKKERSEEYLFKLKRDFPLSLDLRYSKDAFSAAGILQNEPESFAVQVGFFANKKNALKLKNKLFAAGYPAYVESSSGGYRVRVGKFSSREQASSIGKRLSRQGHPTKVIP